MTTEHEALGWVRGEPVRDSWDSEPYATWTLPPSTIPYEIPRSLEDAIRAQVDEDVRRLVAAARLADDHIWCECVLQPPPHEDILCKPHKALRAALEPFKATTVEEGRSDA